MSRPRSAMEILLLLGLNGMAELLLFISSVLRETPEFWRNEGGYPVFLRNLVHSLHYPLLFVVFGTTVTGSLLAIRFFDRHRGIGTGLLVIAVLQWIFFAISLVIMLWNNVDNLLNGRPLHYHPPI